MQALTASVRRHVGEMAQEARRYLDASYPRFVTHPDPPPIGDEVPIFVFHTIEPDEFEVQLRFLTDNGYRTIDCDTLVAGLAGETELPPKSVMITIDDGRASVWTYAFPILKKYRHTAVAFLIPGYIRESGGTTPSLDDVWASRARAEDLRPGDPGLMSWEEIEAIAKTDVIDFQSHTLFHHKVPVSDRIVGFVSPRNHDAIFDLAVPRGLESWLIGSGRDALFGVPIFMSDSLMAEGPRFEPDPGLLEACLDMVKNAGGRAFFAENDWQRRLQGEVDAWRDKHGGLGRLIEGEARRSEIVADLVRSRELIETRIPARSVRHLCYPNTIGSELAVRASREAGFASNYWGVLPDRRCNRPGGDPFHCVRLKSDFVLRLPGRDRKSLARIAFDKARRRLSGKPIY